jgi:hypothetical protein
MQIEERVSVIPNPAIVEEKKGNQILNDAIENLFLTMCSEDTANIVFDFVYLQDKRTLRFTATIAEVKEEGDEN